ncbi:MAG: SMC family ATPase [Candidatus Eremiobacteraeota bacterium]|nr:SMC family ATPase [Candidatus Eremiobacteraeota bacterium]MCW5868942.1 SMC family ATPase [Candidatus Eremiobacteraeota bacterium]
MKPLRLALQAFGPFWNRVEVDFRPAQAQGLFLIHGPVGSGKTTLLDGICYALYGVSSGGERSPEQLRSDLAPDSTETRVEFDFQTDGTEWSVQRDGQEARLLQAGQAVVRGTLEVNQRIQRLIGLDAFQFCRSVLLPQGQFRQFLLAQAGDREQILAALFHTHSPRLYQEALSEALSQAEEELSAAWRRRESSSGVHQQMRWQEEQLQSLTHQLERWKEQSSRLQADRQRAAVVGERSRERQRLHKDLAQLRERDEDVRELREQARRLQGALKVAPQVEQWQQARKDELAAQENYRKAQQELQERMQGLTPPADTADQLEAAQLERERLQQRLHDLARYESENKRLAQAEERLQRCRDTWNQMEEEGQVMTRELEVAERRLQEVVRFGAEESELKHQLMVRQKQLERLRDQHKLIRQQEELQTGIERSHQTLIKIGERRNRTLTQIDLLERDLHERQRQLEAHWSHALASQLRPGQPCPVCGAQEHPAPASPGGSPAQLSLEQLRKQVDLAWKQAEKIEQEEQEQQITLVRLEERLEAAMDRARDLPAASPSELQEITASLRELEKDLQRLQAYREHQERDQRRVRKLKRKLEGWQEARLQAQQALAQAEAIVQERRSLVPEEFTLEGSLAAERERLHQALEPVLRSIEQNRLQIGADTHLYASFTAAAEAARQSIELSQERTRLAWELVQARLELQGFADLEEWRPVFQLAEHDLETILGEIASHQQSLELLEAESERADALYHESLEDWRELEIDPEGLENQLQAGYAAVAQAQEELRRLQRQWQDYERSLQEIQSLEPRLALLRRLARTAAGDNPLGITFQQWVLAQQMESVLQAANLRLSQMTRGRFTLEASKNALELLVLDHLSGHTRAVTTLSGGESFLASLALALGLSDSFLSAGSNAVLETLFIDEGFGYLDEEGLDQAFWALEPIRKDGRIIGVVSHLAEVRQRIETRLEIRPSPSGNQISWG